MKSFSFLEKFTFIVLSFGLISCGEDNSSSKYQENPNINPASVKFALQEPSIVKAGNDPALTLNAFNASTQRSISIQDRLVFPMNIPESIANVAKVQVTTKCVLPHGAKPAGDAINKVEVPLTKELEIGTFLPPEIFAPEYEKNLPSCDFIFKASGWSKISHVFTIDNFSVDFAIEDNLEIKDGGNNLLDSKNPVLTEDRFPLLDIYSTAQEGNVGFYVLMCDQFDIIASREAQTSTDWSVFDYTKIERKGEKVHTKKDETDEATYEQKERRLKTKIQLALRKNPSQQCRLVQRYNSRTIGFSKLFVVKFTPLHLKTSIYWRDNKFDNKKQLREMDVIYVRIDNPHPFPIQYKFNKKVPAFLDFLSLDPLKLVGFKRIPNRYEQVQVPRGVIPYSKSTFNIDIEFRGPGNTPSIVPPGGHHILVGRVKYNHLCKQNSRAKDIFITPKDEIVVTELQKGFPDKPLFVAPVHPSLRITYTKPRGWDIGAIRQTSSQVHDGRSRNCWLL